MGGPTSKKKDAKALIKTARRPERVVPVCLRADLMAEVAQLEQRIKDLENEPGAGASLAGAPNLAQVRELAAEQQVLREQMRESTVDFRLRALAPRQWTELLAKYPPRKGVRGDELNGCNVDEHAEAMVRACLVDPVLDDDEYQHLLTEALSDGAWNKLVVAAWAVNQQDTDIPFTPAGSRIRGLSAAG